ncbi:MAG: DUF58 domain-containing protein [Phycisphaerae bacterium]|nr:DUF58 domain-containing protein [Phycisphaerae bacterium]
MPSSRKYLEPETISRLAGLELRARRAVSGAISGMHRSIYRGNSVEFAEHRPYVPGDDIRHIDWRLFGRKDRLFIKQYEEETNLRLHILLDVSASMNYGQGGANKLEYAKHLAASLAYVVLNQHDFVGLVAFDNELRATLPAATGGPQMNNVLQVLEKTRGGGRTRMGPLLDRLSEELRRRSIVVLISDLLADGDEALHGVEHLTATGHELVVFHVLHSDEIDFPFLSPARFEGLEESDLLRADPQALRRSYRRAVERYCARLHAVCIKRRADYLSVNTSVPVGVTLTGYLSRRSGKAPPVAPSAELTAEERA